MDTSPEDRLKAFLERNRNRLTQNSISSSAINFENSLLPPPSSIEKAISDAESYKANSILLESSPLGRNIIPETSDFTTHEFEQRVSNHNGIFSQNAIFSTINSDLPLNSHDTNSQQATETPKRSAMTQSAIMPRSARRNAAGRLSMTIDSNSKMRINNHQRGLSTSPIRFTPFDNHLSTKINSRIEKYILDRKQARSKIKARVRSLSTESSTILKPFKNPTLFTQVSVKFGAYDAVSRVSSTTLSQHDDHSSQKSTDGNSKPHKVQLSDILFAKEKKKPFSATKSKISVSSSVVKREYVFEESEDARKKSRNRSGVRPNSKGKSKSKSGTRSKSKAVSPMHSLNQVKTKNVAASDVKNNGRGRSPDRSPSRGGSQMFFQESSKKLNVLDSSLTHGHKFKKEIKNLISIIKREREQISSELETMTKELKKYKNAYKSLKNEVKSGKDSTKDSSPAKLSMNSLNISKNATEGRCTPDERTPTKEQAADKIAYPFTINELTQYIESSVPVHNEENIEDLLAKIDSVHTDVESILNKNDVSMLKSPQKRGIDQRSFELRKTSINYFIVREMNLPLSLFFQDYTPEEPLDSKPNLIDLLAAQREIIYFLIKKLQIEEQQRLKTEEQASKMIVSMEKTVKQMEDKGSSIRKKEPFGQHDLNKSSSSAVTSKFDVSDHIA